MAVTLLTIISCMFVPIVTSYSERVIFSCNFDTDFCDFEIVASQHLQWIRGEDAETWEGNSRGCYAYVSDVDGSFFNNGKAAVITTPIIEVSRFRLSFSYALYGDDVIFLQTDYRYNGTVNLLHWVPVQETSEWMSFVGDFNATSKFTVQYTAVKKRGNDGYIAIDNVTITELLDDEFTTFTMRTSIETHTRAVVTYEHQGNDSERTVLPTVGKTSLNMSKSAIELIWKFFVGVIIAIILCALLVCFLRSSLIKRCKRSSKENDYVCVHTGGAEIASDNATTTLKVCDHYYENMNCSPNQTDLAKGPERISRNKWRKYFQRSRSEDICSMDRVNEVDLQSLDTIEQPGSSPQIVITSPDEASRTSSDIRPLSQTPISLKWTPNPNYEHSPGEEPQYHELSCDDGEAESSENCTDRLAKSNESGEPHVYAKVNKSPSKTIWEENPIYEGGEEVENSTVL